MRILLVEDEPDLTHWLSRTLARHAGIMVEWANDGVLADRRLATEEFDAVVLDLGLPGLDGHGVLARLRARDDRTPVLVLTARDSLAERVGTLHEGADDFLPKPFMVEELEARLLALVRRARGNDHPRLACGPLQLDAGSRRFSVAGEPLALPPREHSVLRALIQRSGEPVTKQQILDRVLPGDTDVNLEAVEVHVHRLRKKLAGSGVQITTVRGMGYCLEPVTHPDPESAPE
jgi:two-component system response regulator TctD